MSTPRIPIPHEAIAAFCRRWKITELALFGSVLREDFGPGSDVDVLVVFAAGAPWTYFKLFEIRSELEAILGRKVDLLTRASVEQHHNPWLKHSILSEAAVCYRAA